MTTQFKLPHKFVISFHSAAKYAPSHMFIGGGSYYFFLPYSKDIAREFIKTPLVNNRVSRASMSRIGKPLYEYFINVTYITVDHKLVCKLAIYTTFYLSVPEG